MITLELKGWTGTEGSQLADGPAEIIIAHDHAVWVT